jgi:hypothetical protein
VFLSKDDWVSKRAYALWENEGRPEGRGEVHWQQAASEHELLELTKASADGSDMIERLRSMGRLMGEFYGRSNAGPEPGRTALAR